MMAGAQDHRIWAGARLAAGCWFTAGVLYLGVERLAASAFVPAYSYARNYVSDLGVPACGIIYQGRPICSPLHALMNLDFVLQGLLFFAAAVAAGWSLKTPAKIAFIAFAALNGAGNVLIGLFPETSPVMAAGGLSLHVAGALLAIVFGNAAALMSAWTFEELRLARIHRGMSIALPLIAAISLTMLGLGSCLFPDGVWERMSVYTITAWQVVSAACVTASMTKRHRS